MIGLDGADWRILTPLIAAGKMPNLAALVSNGASGRLASTVRPESSVAWSTFATGANPGKHGVYGFMRPADPADPLGSYALTSGADIQAPRFWRLLAERGVRTGLLHLPFTFPVRSINGFCVSGMLTPGGWENKVEFVYPPELQQSLMAQFDQLQFDIGEAADHPERLLTKGISFTQHQVEMARVLLSEVEVDLFCVVLTAIDRIQHFAWPAGALQDGQYDIDKMSPKFVRFFEAVDVAIGELIALFPDDTSIFLLSDHGFNGVGRKFYVNRWLEEAGYLTVNRGGENRRQQITTVLELLKQSRILRRMKRAFLPKEWGPNRFRAASTGWSIDWGRSFVFFSPDGGLRFRPGLSDMEVAELKAKLSTELLAVTDPSNGCCPIAHIYDRSQLYEGPSAASAPDLIVEPQRDLVDPGQNYILVRSNAGDDPIWGASAPYNGNHAPEGILVAHGTGIQPKTSIQNATLADIAPTLLAMMGGSVPAYIDGEPLLQLFEPDQRPVVIRDPRRLEDFDLTSENKQLPLSKTENQIVEDRLRNLGYID